MARARLGRGTIVAAVAGVAVVATVVTLAVNSDGYVAQEVPHLETSVWVTRDAGQYARVNTDLGEIDLVRDVDDPSAVVQHGAAASVYSQGLRQRWLLDGANPADLIGDEAAGAGLTPTGTRDVAAAGDWVAYRTDTGTVYAGTVAGDDATPIDPYAARDDGEPGDDESETYSATAVGVSPNGLVAMYSAREGGVRRYDAREGELRGDADQVADPPAADVGVQLTVVGERWVLLDAADGRVWIAGRGAAIAVDVSADARLQQGVGDAASVLIADGDGLVSVPLEGGEPQRILEAAGVPAQPVAVDGEMTAAWISGDGGTLWTSAADEPVPLDAPSDPEAGPQSVTPVLQTNGDRAVLNDTSSGLVWTVPDGRMIPLEQWALDDDVEDRVGTELVEDLARQEPPVAVADAFGVRAGEQVELPVLLNDHDPNAKDVLTVDPASMGQGLADAGFGELSLTSNDQVPTVRVRATSGSTTFTYAVSDGAAASAPVTVTLTVVAPDVNSAPAWCSVDACAQRWPTPQLMPGGTALVPVLSGWVDREGDPFVLTGAHPADPASPVAVVPMADGRIAVRHTDPNAGAATIAVQLTIADVHGAAAEATLDVRVTTGAALDVAPVAVTTGAGETAIVQVADHVSGGSGSLRLLDAVPTASAASGGLAVVPNAAAGEVELTAAEPGAYLATFTVQDLVTRAEQSATIRITVAAPGAPLAIAPMTAFVRAGEDTMVDVLGAVQNTSGRVLVVSGAVASTPELGVGVVAQSQVRVTGVTRDGQPGLVGRGRVTVSDGAGATAVGDLSVFLVASSAGLSPIAMPDTLTMRAGELVSIQVTANDVSPRAERLVVHPEVTGSGADGELVFAAGDSVRYLAPDAPGTYELGYAVGLEQAPDRLDHSTVTVTVLPDGANRAPEPHPLVARVLSGQSVRIAVASTGMDPDGDRTVLASVTQPAAGAGVATISAEGDAIVYTAPADGTGDVQPAFEYTVRDASGAEGTGRVRVGVLAAAVTDAAPVTFSDYVRVQQSSSSPVTVEPAGNDLDPAQGELELVRVVPNAPDDSPEYARLSALLDTSTSLEQGRVVLRAGDVVGTNSYRYTVESKRTSSTAEGLVVVNVTEAAQLDGPVVGDTVVTARTRADLGGDGIDVVSGRVTWASGDVRTLELELWGDGAAKAGYTVDGHRISGPLPDGGALVPFRLAGSDASGREVEAFGFLIVPAAEDLRVQLRPELEPIDVQEESSTVFDIRELLDLPARDEVEIAADGDYPVQRAAATCRPEPGDRAEYTAGRDAPWSDRCLIAVRLDGQRSWSWVAVPIAIIPKDPQAILTAVTRTVAPGAAESVHLYDEMTTWEGGREGDRAGLDFTAAFAGSAFLVRQEGDVVAIEARADARPGTRETVTVGVSAFGGLTSTLTLVVGQAPADAPRGAVFTRQCSVADGASCTIDVVGVTGEYDPFAGKTGSGLTLQALGAGTCPVAAVRASGQRAVTVTWPSGQDAYGGECTVPFTVADAQGRVGDGRLTVDLLGLPQAPASVSTADFTGTSVTLEISLGEAMRAHPAVTGIEILEGGRVVTADCRTGAPGAWQCVVQGLTSGERHDFAARAVNAVGVSSPTNAVTTWGYEAPTIGSVTAEPVYRNGVTSTGAGVVELRIDAEGDARAFRVEQTGQVIDRRGQVTTADVVLSPGPQMITLVPISIYEPPTGRGGNEGGASVTPVTVAGAPYLDPNRISAGAASNTSIVITGVGLAANHSSRAQDVVYFAWRDGAEPECWADGSGALAYDSRSAVVSTSSTISGLDERKRYAVKACASNGFGVAASGVTEVRVYTSVGVPTGDATYTVSVAPAGGGDSFTYGLATAPQLTAAEDFHVEYFVYGEWVGDFTGALREDSAPSGVVARQCHDVWGGNYCSAEISVNPATAPTIVAVDFANGCIAPENPAAPTADEVGLTVSRAAAGSVALADPVHDPVAGTVAFTIRFNGAYAALKPITRTATLCPVEPPPNP